MEKQTKNIITRASIESDLRWINTGDIRSTIFLCVMLGVFCIPCSMAMLFAAVPNVPMISLQVICVILGLLFLLPVVLNGIALAKHLKRRRQIANGEFEIKAVELSYKEERPYQRSTAEYLNFSGFERYMVGHTTYQLVSSDDLFYLVYFKGSNVIELAFAAKLYEYQP